MVNYRGKGGIEVTDAMVDQWDRDADRGVYHGKPGKLIVRHPIGRPALYEEPMVPVTFRLPGSQVRALRNAAKARGVSFADVLREACAKELHTA